MGRMREMADAWLEVRSICAVARQFGVTKSSVCQALHKTGTRLHVPLVEALPPPVDRDPCWRCGVRGDIGCDHRR